MTQLLEGGLIRNYVNKENDKVAKLASGSSRLKFKKKFLDAKVTKLATGNSRLFFNEKVAKPPQVPPA